MRSTTFSFRLAAIAAVFLGTAPTLQAFTAQHTNRPRATSWQLDYSNEVSLPSPISPNGSPLIPQDKRLSPTGPTTHPNVQRVTTVAEFDQCMAAASGPVVVRFFAEYCRACKASTPHFRRLVTQHGENVQFVEVSATAAREVFVHHGVTRMPWGQVYQDGALVHEGSLSRTKIAAFASFLDDMPSASPVEAPASWPYAHPATPPLRAAIA